LLRLNHGSCESQIQEQDPILSGRPPELDSGPPVSGPDIRLGLDPAKGKTMLAWGVIGSANRRAPAMPALRRRGMAPSQAGVGERPVGLRKKGTLMRYVRLKGLIAQSGSDRLPLALSVLLLANASCPPGALAQASSPAAPAAADHETTICSSVPKAGCIMEPAADTPVPPQYQASYKVYLDMNKAAHGGTVYTRANFAKMPDWSGLWTHKGFFYFDQTPAAAKVPNHMTADLTPEFKAQYEAKLAQVKRGIEWDPLSFCLPAGFPRFLVEPYVRQMIVTPQQTIWINEWQSETRRIYTDGRGHVPEDEAFPLWEGDSIGFWDGDTLVVHTIRMRPTELQRLQPSISDEASTVERIRMVDPNTIVDDATLWDPKALNKPWHITQSYTRVTTPDVRLDMFSCDENNNVVKTAEGGSVHILPGEKGYKNPDTFAVRPVDAPPKTGQ
jgi:hypothetical protein